MTKILLEYPPQISRSRAGDVFNGSPRPRRLVHVTSTKTSCYTVLLPGNKSVESVQTIHFVFLSLGKGVGRRASGKRPQGIIDLYVYSLSQKS